MSFDTLRQTLERAYAAGVAADTFADPVNLRSHADGLLHVSAICGTRPATDFTPAPTPLDSLDDERLCRRCGVLTTGVVQSNLDMARLLTQARVSANVCHGGPVPTWPYANPHHQPDPATQPMRSAGALRDYHFRLSDHANSVSASPHLAAEVERTRDYLRDTYTALAPLPGFQVSSWVDGAIAAQYETNPAGLLSPDILDQYRRVGTGPRIPSQGVKDPFLDALYGAVIDSLLDGRSWAAAQAAAQAAGRTVAGTSISRHSYGAPNPDALVTLVVDAWRDRIDTGRHVPRADLEFQQVAFVWLGAADVRSATGRRSRVHQLLAPASVRSNLEDSGCGVVAAPAGVVDALTARSDSYDFDADDAGPRHSDDTVETYTTAMKLRMQNETMPLTSVLAAARAITAVPVRS